MENLETIDIIDIKTLAAQNVAADEICDIYELTYVELMQIIK